jgi:glycosyltransferase involved in cell wall biosynthesis
MSAPHANGRPELSVVILSYRNELTIGAAIRSLIAQDEDVEIIVSHSGGGVTPRILAEYVPRVRVVTTSARRLPGAARNAGVASSRARYIAFLAGDCIALPGWVAGRLARHRDGAEAVACAMTPTDSAAPSLASYLLQHSGRMQHLPMPAPRYRYGLSYTRDILERYGPFPETLTAGEDSIVKWRLIAAGVDIAWAPEVVTAHRYPTTVQKLFADQYRRGRWRSATGRVSRIRVVEQVLLEAPAALWRASRPGSQITAGTLARLAPLICTGALATAAGVMRGSPSRYR